MRSLATVLFALSLVTPCGSGSGEKLTTDPNAPEVAAAQLDDAQQDKPDPRLLQKITYNAANAMVHKVLEDLTETTGVTLNSGYSKMDWQVRERRMNLFVKDVPLAALMNSIARVHKFKWSVSDKDGVLHYRLTTDTRALLEADTAFTRRREELERQQAEKRKKWVEDLLNLGNLSPADLEKLKEDNPHMYAYAAGGVADSIAAMLRALPEIANRLISGEESIVSCNELSPSAREAVVRALEQMRRYRSRLRVNGPTFSDDPEEYPPDVAVLTNRTLNERREDFLRGVLDGGLHLIGDLWLCFWRGAVAIDLADPDSRSGRASGTAYYRCFEEDKTLDEPGVWPNSEGERALVSDLRKLDFGEPPAEHPDDPELQKKMKLEVAERELPKLQEAFAKAFGFSVISDSFSGMYALVSVGSGEMEVKSALDRIADAYSYNWWKRGSLIEFRDRYWFVRRSAQIPEARIESWRQAFKKNGILDLDELIQIATITLAQYNANVRNDKVLAQHPLPMLIAHLRRFLRFCGSLSANQRAMLFTRSGIDLQSLTPEQMLAAREGLKYSRTFAADPSACHIVCGEKQPKGKGFEYTFTARTADGILVGTLCEFTTPEYKPPQKEAPKTPEPAKQTTEQPKQ